MTSPITRERFDAVLFDLDGVLTDTASLHAATWKTMFDEFLAARSGGAGERVEPFDTATDYTRFVDGRPRFDGVRGFLGSRGIDLPEGDPADPPGAETVCGLGNRKNRLILEMLARGEVKAYEGSVALVRRLRRDGIRTAVVSASHNAEAVLEAAGIADLFDARVDGNTADREGIPGKPDPAPFLAAARALDVSAARSVVVEDAIAGVQAGRAGRFGLVVGVDRRGDPGSLRDNGADVVVSDLAELVE